MQSYFRFRNYLRLIAVAVIAAVPSAWAATASTVSDEQTKVSFPSEAISIVKTFDVLARASGNKYVVPAAISAKQLADLDAQIAGKTLSVAAVTKLFCSITHDVPTKRGNFVVLCELAALTPVTPEAMADYQTGLQLASKLTDRQIAEMSQASFVTPDWLTEEQRPLYVKCMRQMDFIGALYTMTGQKHGIFSDAELLSFRLHFYIISTASVRLRGPSNQIIDWMGLYDYTHGQPIGIPTDGAYPMPPDLPKHAANSTKQNVDLAGVTPVTAPDCHIKFGATAQLSIKSFATLYTKQTGQKVEVDQRLSSVAFVVTEGNFSGRSLMHALCASFGLELRHVGSTYFLGYKQSDLMRQREQAASGWAQIALRKLMVAPMGRLTPFAPEIFADDTVLDFKSLSDVQKEFLKHRFTNGYADNPDNVVFDKVRVEFKNMIWLQATYTYGITFMTPSLQLW